MNAGDMGGGGGSRGRRRGGKVLSEINMTPLVDVMLVLLVIFIITAPSLKDSLHVDLPRAKGEGKSQATMPYVRTVVIDERSRVHFEGSTIELRDVPTELPKLLRPHAGETMTLKAYRLLPYETAIQVFDVMRRSGLKGINVAVDASGK